MGYIIEEAKELTEENDFLGTLNKAKAITEYIKNNEDIIQKNNMIALYGQWGTGKSSVLKTIKKNLHEPLYKTIWIDMWKEENNYIDLSSKILNQILESLGIKDVDVKRDILKGFMIACKGFKASLPIISYDFKPALDYLTNEIDNVQKEKENIKKFSEKFNEIIKKHYEKNKSKIVVFLDDLDRCNNDNMLNIIYNIKTLLSIENIIFIFGIDKEAVTLALRNKYNNEENKADSFLDKIFPISFNMPCFILNGRLLIILRNYFPELPDNTLEIIIQFLLKINFTNPRELIKALNKYEMIKDELKRKKVIDISSIWYIVLIIFLIIEHEFNYKSYIEILQENKKRKINKFIKCYIIKGDSGAKHSFAYDSQKINIIIYNEIMEREYIESDIFEQIIDTNKMTEREIQADYCRTSIEAGIKFESWLSCFQVSRNTMFAEFLMEHREYYNINRENLYRLAYELDILL